MQSLYLIRNLDEFLLYCVFPHGRMMETAITDVPRRDDKEINEKVPQQVETPSVQAQDTFPSYQAQLDELRPLVNARLHEGTTW